MLSAKISRPAALRLLIILLALGFLYLPILTLIVYSFNESRMVTVWTGASLKWYYELFSDAAIGKAVGISLLLAFMTASTSVVIGTLAAFVLVRVRSFRGESLFLLLITAPMVLPEVITGLAMLLIFVTLGESLSFFSDRGIMALWVSHVTFCTAYATVVIRSRFRELDVSIEEAAMDLGAGPIKVFFAIILPAIMPAEVAAFLLSFTMSLDDLVITSFIAGPDSTTLPMLIFSSVRRGLSPEINALATIIVLIVSIFTFFAWLSMVKKQKRIKSDEAKAKASAKAEEAQLHKTEIRDDRLSQEHLELLHRQVAALREGRDIAEELSADWHSINMRLGLAGVREHKSEREARQDGDPSSAISSIMGGDVKAAVSESSLAHHKEQVKAAAVRPLGETAKEATNAAAVRGEGAVKLIKVVDRSSGDEKSAEKAAKAKPKAKTQGAAAVLPEAAAKGTTITSLAEAKAKASAKAAGMTSGKSQLTGTTTSSLKQAKAKVIAKATTGAPQQSAAAAAAAAEQTSESSVKAKSASLKSDSAIAATKQSSEKAKIEADLAKVVDDTMNSDQTQSRMQSQDKDQTQP